MSLWDVVEATIKVTYLLPSDPADRTTIYGSTDPGECVQIDLEVDAAAFFDNADDIRLLSVEVVDE